MAAPAPMRRISAATTTARQPTASPARTGRPGSRRAHATGPAQRGPASIFPLLVPMMAGDLMPALDRQQVRPDAGANLRGLGAAGAEGAAARRIERRGKIS